MTLSTTKPHTTGYAEIDGVKLFYQIFGSGDPFLLLHGGLGSSEIFQKNIPAFAEHFRVITLDQRGHGRSYDTPEPFSYSAMAEDTETFLRFLEIPSCFVLGFSDGGVVAYHLASKHPTKVRKLIAVGAPCGLNGMTTDAVTWIRNRLTYPSAIQDFPQIEEEFKRLSPRPEALKAFLEKTRMFWLSDPYFEKQDLRKIRAPVLLVAGDKDAVTSEHMSELRTALTNADLQIVPEATHFLLLEKPEIVNPMVTDFLRS